MVRSRFFFSSLFQGSVPKFEFRPKMRTRPAWGRRSGGRGRRGLSKMPPCLSKTPPVLLWGPWGPIGPTGAPPSGAWGPWGPHGPTLRCGNAEGSLRLYALHTYARVTCVTLRVRTRYTCTHARYTLRCENARSSIYAHLLHSALQLEQPGAAHA